VLAATSQRQVFFTAYSEAIKNTHACEAAKLWSLTTPYFSAFYPQPLKIWIYLLASEAAPALKVEGKGQTINQRRSMWFHTARLLKGTVWLGSNACVRSGTTYKKKY
jgi:hypothetical protein